MNAIKYYISRGVKADEFVKVCNKLFPIRTEAADRKPRFEVKEEKYRVPPCTSTTPQYQNALHLAVESLRFDSPIAHVEKIDDGKFIVRPMPYSVRTAFTTYADVKHMGYTLRDIVFPHPFTLDGRFEGVNNYPFPKPMGVNILLIDPENNLVLQKRQNLHFDANKIAATAAGGVEFDVMLRSNNPLEEIIIEELKEEMNYTGKITDLTYIGYIINYQHILDISHAYIGWADEPFEDFIENKEVAKVIKIPLKSFENIEKTLCKHLPKDEISTSLAGIIDIINKKFRTEAF